MPPVRDPRACSEPMRPYASRALWWACLLVSGLAHLAGLVSLRVPGLDAEEQKLKLRLVQPPRVRPPLLPGRFSLPGPGDQVLRPYAGLSPAPGQPEGLGRIGATLTRPAVPAYGGGPVAPPGALREFGVGDKADTFALTPEPMPSPVPYQLAGRGGKPRIDATDLLRMADLARAHREHAAIMPDRSSRQDVRGYINFTELRVRGARADVGGGLDGLARYLRDHTRILAQVSPGYYDYFLSEQLLKDPIHFLLQDPDQCDGADSLVHLAPEEMDLLRRYLRAGGFLFIEGNPVATDATAGCGQYRFLREMVARLQAVLGSQARFVRLPSSHPLYHAYYDFDSGFPGEEGGPPPEPSAGPGGSLPGYDRPDALPSIPNVDPRLAQQSQADRPPPAVGLWGVELDQELVAVFSDLGLHAGWAVPADAAESEGGTFSLMAATNIVAYALNRPGGLTAKLEQPAWRVQKPLLPMPAPSLEAGPGGGPPASSEAGLYDELDASLALIHSPLGRPIEPGGVRVMVDGRYAVEVLKRGLHGVVLRNLPAGPHWIEVRYGGKSRQLEVGLEGGRVTTAVFGLDRVAFFTQLTLRAQKTVVDTEGWVRGFADLQLEEVFLGDDRRLLEPGAAGE